MSVDSIIFPDLRICQPERRRLDYPESAEVNYQDTGFRFGIDSVVLAWFATLKKQDRVIDIGSGSGVLSALLVRLKNAKNVTAVELQPEMYACLEQTVHLNEYAGMITPINTDIRTYRPEQKFNLAICNPPYRTVGTGNASADRVEQMARFDNTLTLDEILQFCRKYLNYGGRFAFTGDADRLVGAICGCREQHFEPKRLTFLYPDAAKRPKIYFLECVYGGGEELIMEPPVIQNSDGELYTKILQGKWK